MITTSIQIEPYLAEYLRGKLTMVLMNLFVFPTIRTCITSYGH